MTHVSLDVTFPTQQLTDDNDHKTLSCPKHDPTK